MKTKKKLEEGCVFTPEFGDNGLIACIVQDWQTDEVVMFAYMNEQSLAKTIQTGSAWYWSRSRGELWHKGAVSGSIQTVHEIRIDCDQDALIIKITTGGNGSNCHRGTKSCFYRQLIPDRHNPGRTVLITDEME